MTGQKLDPGHQLKSEHWDSLYLQYLASDISFYFGLNTCLLISFHKLISMVTVLNNSKKKVKTQNWAMEEQLCWMEATDIREGVIVLFVCFSPGCTSSTCQIWSSVLPPKGDFEEHQNNFIQAINSLFTCLWNISKGGANRTNRYACACIVSGLSVCLF